MLHSRQDLLLVSTNLSNGNHFGPAICHIDLAYLGWLEQTGQSLYDQTLGLVVSLANAIELEPGLEATVLEQVPVMMKCLKLASLVEVGACFEKNSSAFWKQIEEQTYLKRKMALKRTI